MRSSSVGGRATVGLPSKNALEIVGEFLGRGIAIVAPLRHGFQDHGLEVGGNLWLELSRGPRLVALDVPEQGRPLLARKRRLQRQQLVECRPQRINVRAMVDQGRLPQRLFGTHVTHRAHQVAGARQGGLALAVGQSEVGHPELAVAVQQQIGGLDVAMHDAVFVGRVQGGRRLNSQANDRPKIVPQLRQGPIQRLPVDQLHGIVVDSPFHADGKHRYDIGMVELRGSLGLMFEAGDLPAVEDGRERQDLQGHAPAQRDLFRLVDHAHAAPADFPQKTKIAQPPFIADRRCILAGRIDGRPLEPGRHLVQLVQAVKVGMQGRGQIGIRRQQVLAGRRQPPFQSAQIAVQHVGQAILLLRGQLPNDGGLDAQVEGIGQPKRRAWVACIHASARSFQSSG